MHHKMAPLANEIKITEDSYRVKAKGGEIVADVEWNRMAPGILAEMFEFKMQQHPDLLERLLDTYPLPLIEACKDDTWGGGPPLIQMCMTVTNPCQVEIYSGKWPLNTGTTK